MSFKSFIRDNLASAEFQSGKEEDGSNEVVQSFSDNAVVSGTMESIREAKAAEKSVGFPLDLVQRVRTLGRIRNDESIKSFLSKPEIALRGVLSTTDTATTFTGFSAFSGLNTTLKANKMAGVFTIRATTVVRIQINANPFQQGLYMVCYLPTGGVPYTTGSNTPCRIWVDSHRYTLVQCSQLRHIKMNLSCDTEKVLRIPYLSSTNGYVYSTTGTGIGDPGQVFLRPILPLNYVAGSSTATFSIWVHYEDVEIFGDVVPQAGQEELVERPLSSSLRIVASASGTLARIPMLTSIFQPLSWVAEAAGGLAHAFGFSKPIVQSEVSRMVREPFPYMANADVADNSSPLSLMVRNEVEIAPGYASTNVDEMTIDYLKRIWSIGAFNIGTYSIGNSWSTAGAVGLGLGNGLVTPADNVWGVSDTATFTYNHTPISLLSQLFSYWTGSLELKFTFAATCFHSGRLMFAWAPYDVSVTAGSLDVNSQAYVHKTIFDLREASEFVVRIPFVAPVAWNDCETVGEASALSVGGWTLIIIDPLVAPATVPSTVSFICEFRGGEDMRFSFPRQFRYVAAEPAALQAGEEDECLTSIDTVGSVSDSRVGFAAEGVCIGEVITSLKQLLSRGGFVNNSGITTSGVNQWFVNPFIWGISRLTAVDPPPQTNICYDYYSLFSSIYALNRGGIRIKFPIYVVGASNGVFVTMYRRNPLNNVNTGNFQVNGVAASSLLNLVQNYGPGGTTYMPCNIGGVGVNVPQYHVTHSRASAACMYSDSLTANSLLSPRVLLIFLYVGTGNGTPEFYRSGSEDTHFGGFVSIPAMILPSQFSP